MSEPVSTQPIPPSLENAVCLLDGVLLRDDVPLDARLELSDIYSDLLDVRPPYPPVFADSAAGSGQSWTVGVEGAITALNRLIADPDPSANPAVILRYGLAIHRLRATRTGTPGEPTGRPQASAES